MQFVCFFFFIQNFIKTLKSYISWSLCCFNLFLFVFDVYFCKALWNLLKVLYKCSLSYIIITVHVHLNLSTGHLNTEHYFSSHNLLENANYYTWKTTDSNYMNKPPFPFLTFLFSHLIYSFSSSTEQVIPVNLITEGMLWTKNMKKSKQEEHLWLPTVLQHDVTIT